MAAIVVGMYFYVDHLQISNDFLTKENTRITLVMANRVAALIECSNSVGAFKTESDTKTTSAQVAIQEAKKESTKDYIIANDILFFKPTLPTVSTTSVQNFGGSDKTLQLNDYLQTQALMNKFIVSRSK